MAPTLDGVSLEGCDDISIEKSANIIVLPILTQDSTTNELFDFLGVTRIITVSGKVGEGSEALAISNKLEEVLNGDQTTTVILSYTPLGGSTRTYSGMIAVFSVNWKVLSNILFWEFKLFEGTSV